MNNALFVKYLEHFIEFIRPCAENKILVILDGHQSHKSLQVIDMASANHITIITFRDVKRSSNFRTSVLNYEFEFNLHTFEFGYEYKHRRYTCNI